MYRTLKYHLAGMWLILRSRPTTELLTELFLTLARRMAQSLAPHRPELESVLNQFRSIVSTRQFTAEWFEDSIPTWMRIDALTELKRSKSKPTILEIGSFEGRSTLFFLSYFPESQVTVIDLWNQDVDPQSVSEGRSSVEMRFDRNVAEYSDRIIKMRGMSAECLGKLVAGRPSKFDLVYVDGSHFSDDVMTDALLSWSMLKSGGTMIFDDYLWTDADYGYRKQPCLAINLFLRLMKGEYTIAHVGYQVIVVKTVAIRNP
jgi:predicted O-methyltransferase YrrM